MKREESPTRLLRGPKCTGLWYHLRGGVPCMGCGRSTSIYVFLAWNVRVPDRVFTQHV